MLNHVDTNGDEVHGAAAVFGWIADEVAARTPLDKSGRPAKTILSLMDGQESLWDTRDVFQPDVEMVDILDLLHVTPKLWSAANVFHKTGSDEATRFVRKRVTRILKGEVSSVVSGLRRLATTHKLSGNKLKTIQTIIGYYEKNAHRMRYDEYLAAGYPIASGVIEGACRNVVKDRLERTGMSWNIEGAQSMLSLRCIHLACQWEQYTQFRIDQQMKKLYPQREKLPKMPWNTAA